MKTSTPYLQLPVSKPLYLSLLLSFCRLFSFLSAGIQYCFMCWHVVEVPAYILNAQGGNYTNLRNIWYARFVRRLLSLLVRTPFRTSTLQLIHSTIPIPENSGCVIVICHTPWKRILVQWCLKNDFGRIIGSNKWTYRKRFIQRQGKGFNEMRDIVRYLQCNGRIIVATDVFNGLNNCPVQFLGDHHNLSLLPARLARIAGVPLIGAIPTLRNGIININQGLSFNYTMLSSRSCSTIMQKLISFLENEIKKDPSIWPWFVK